MPKYIPVYSHPDRMPVDISFVFENERPAGKHGFAQAKGENIYFEDGTLAKFWGVMFNGSACFPPHDRAEQVAQRLSQAGINIVRFHQMDDEWVAPNLYRLTQGKRLTNTRELCAESLERMDYLIKCLKEKGIYACVDMTTYRRFKPGDGVKDAHLLHDGSRLYAMYDPVMIELQKEFCTKFWNHVNPYTGLAYKDDPVWVMCDIINENNTFINHDERRWYNLIPYYDNMLRDMFAAWLQENNIEYDAYGCPLFTKDAPMIQFRTHLMNQYLQTMKDHIRSLGVKIPLCGSNYHTNYGILQAEEDMDFHDAHSYYYDWRWGEEEKLCTSKTISGNATSPMANQCGNRIHGKPFFMTEWDMPFPNTFRAEGPLWYPATACLQNWTGMTIHTYGYGHDMSKHDLLGKAASNDTIGGVPYREGIFEIWNDPAKFGLFYHGALMFRRGDVSPAKKTIGVKITEDMMGSRYNTLCATGMEVHQVHTILPGTKCDDIEEFYNPQDTFSHETPGMIVSDTGELRRDVKKSIGYIDTPRTKSVYGKLGSTAINKKIVPDSNRYLNGLTVNCKNDFATITLSSLTDADLKDSNNILMTAVGRARNRGAQFDGDKMLDRGTGPIEIEVIKAHIELETTQKILEVWSVDSDGFLCGRIDSQIENGVLKFDIGYEFAAQYYLIYEP